MASWGGSPQADSFAQEAWGYDQWRHQDMDGAWTRDNRWNGQMNVIRAATGGQTMEQATVRVASRQSRLDDYPLTALGGTTYDNLANAPA